MTAAAMSARRSDGLRRETARRGNRAAGRYGRQHEEVVCRGAIDVIGQKGKCSSLADEAASSPRNAAATAAASAAPASSAGSATSGAASAASATSATSLGKLFAERSVFLVEDVERPEIKIIDVFICKLRKKLANASNGKDYIETVWGRGYALREPSEYEAERPA
jgi:Transcriptional regulatory protein, C terminal